MCGRFSQAYTWAEILAFSQPLTVPAGRTNFEPRYNIAPTNEVDIIVQSADSGRELRRARWGLVPPWWKKPLNDLPATFNAREESVEEKAMFRSAFKSRRCIIPVSGFFEWTGAKGDKTPHFISAADGSILGFAGLWERWKDPDGHDILSCTIITREATVWMQAIHDRMPCMLHPTDFDRWLAGGAPKSVLRDPPPELREWIVSRRVNKAGEGGDDPATIAPEVN
jgi:putative SOS response-associated peptidase YedK